MKMKAKRSLVLILGIVCFLALSCYAGAQTAQPAYQVVKAQATKAQGEAGTHITVTTDGQGGTFTFVTSEMGFESKVVKGVPFSADTQTEFTQTLSNGQKIYRKSVATLARDSEGRTRREQTIDAIGPYAGTPHQTISINDPVAGVNYILDPVNRVASKISISSFTWTGTAATGVSVSSGAVGVVAKSSGDQTVEKKTVIIDGMSTVAGGVASATAKIAHAANPRTESLGTITIDGVTAEGTRTVETIPAGAIGNDAPIEIIFEKWYSPELGMVIKSTRNDPMTGDNIYQLINIRRTEPPASLFQVPADYTIKESPVSMHWEAIKK
jgi:hypothetical protein